MKLSSKERLLQILDYLNLNANELAKAIALKRTQNLYDVLNEKVQISGKLASRINENFPQISMQYMINGEGALLNEGTIYKTTESNSNILEEATSDYLSTRRKIKSDAGVDNDSIIYIPIAAQAGYYQHYQDPIYIRQLQKVSLPGLPYKGAQYRLFEVEGDSMEPTLKEGYHVVAQMVESDQWTSIANYYIYVIVTASQILIKRLFRIDASRFAMISDNEDFYPQKMLQIEEIRELWLVKRKLDWNMPPPKKFEITIE